MFPAQPRTSSDWEYEILIQSCSSPVSLTFVFYCKSSYNHTSPWYPSEGRGCEDFSTVVNLNQQTGNETSIP